MDLRDLLVRHFFISLLSIISIISISILALSPASAEVDRAFILRGLSFDCKGCKILGGNSCYIKTTQVSDVYSCADGLGHLFREIISKETKSQFPLPEELERFLRRAAHGEEQRQYVAPALLLLMRHEAGLSIFANNVETYVEHFKPELIELISSEVIPESVFDQLWLIPIEKISPELKAVVAHQSETRGLEDLLKELDVSASEQNQEFLYLFERAIKPLDRSLAAALSMTRQFLVSCVQTSAKTDRPFDCRPEIAENAPEAVRQYLNRVSIQAIFWAFNSGRFGDREFFEHLALTNYREVDAGKVNVLAVQILSRALNVESNTEVEQDSWLKVWWSSNIEDLLFYLALESPEVYGKLKGFLTTVVLKSRDDQLIWLERARKLEAELWPELKEELYRYDAEALVRYPELRKLLASKPPAPAISWRSVVLPGFLFLSVVVCVVLGLRIREARRAMKEKQKGLEPQELLELRGLMQVFGLNLEADDVSLTKAYRAMIKEAHPDKGGASGAEFSDINERYNRARELLSRYRAHAEQRMGE